MFHFSKSFGEEGDFWPLEILSCVEIRLSIRALSRLRESAVESPHLCKLSTLEASRDVPRNEFYLAE